MDKNPWQKSDRVEVAYRQQLLHLSKEIQRIIDTYDYATPQGNAEMQNALYHYSHMLEPWAVKEAAKLWNAVNHEDLRMWRRNAKAISKGLRNIVENTSAGEQMQQFVREQVVLIKSLPTDAGIRAQTLAREAMLKGERSDSIVEKIQELGDLSEGRARCIARTEIAKASSALVRYRGKAIGATHYMWQTAKDGTHYKNGRYRSGVRPAHAHMQGKVCELDNPPAVEGEGFHHPSDFPNCRCWAQLILPDTKLYDFYRSNGII